MEGVDGYFTNLLNEDTYDAGYEDYGTMPFESQQLPPEKDISPLESQQSPPEKESSLTQKTTQKQKGKNFSVDEDKLIVSAWLNVSTDPTQGTNQSKDTFWRRIHKFYLSNKGSLADRSQNSLLHRWGSINEACAKFCACITQINNKNQSGMTVHDRVEEAEKLYKSLDSQKKPFLFRHCWFQLRNQPQWLDKLSQMAAAKTSNKKRKVAKDLSPGLVDLTTQDGNEDVATENIPLQTERPERPMGKKKAKEQRRGVIDGCSAALDILCAKKRDADAEKEIKREERYAQAFALDQQRLDLEQKRLAIEEQKYMNEQRRLEQEKQHLDNEANSLYMKRIAEEQRIMTMDLSGVSDLQKQYYMCLQADIIARRMN